MSHEENKQMILEIIYGMDTVLNLRSGDFQNYFDNIYNEAVGNSVNFNGVQEMNKYIINNCFQYINNKTQLIQQSHSQHINQPSQNGMIETVDIDALKHKKDDKFTMKLKNKQEEFDSLIKKPDPQSVDFSDKYDEEPQNLDVLMNQSLADREEQLKLIQQQYSVKKTNEFLQSQDTRSENKKARDNEKKVTFKIDDKETSDNQNDTSKDNVINFLSKLKTETPKKETLTDNTEIIDMLKTIITNQEKILAKLSKD